jgi:hypothetical protein
MDHGTGGNVLIPRSHARFGDDRCGDGGRYARALAMLHPAADFFALPPGDRVVGAARPLIAHLEPGDLLLWDSRASSCRVASSSPPAAARSGAASHRLAPPQPT